MNKDKKPEWYKRLQTGPMEAREDKEIFIRKIKKSVHMHESVKKIERKKTFHIKALTVTVVCTFIIVLMNVQQPGFGNNDDSAQSSMQITVKMRDESFEDGTLQQFINELNQKLSLKNKDALHGIISEELVFKGEKYNKNEWGISDDILSSLQVALSMGGEFVNDTKSLYKIPSGLAESNEKKQEHYLYGTIVGEKTNVFAEPKRNSKVVHYVSNEMVKAWIPVKSKNDGYIKISTMNGNTGYVKEEHISTDIDYSFIFEKQNDGSWKIKIIDSIW
ncbi:anti-sigma factor [Bacillus clarus]|uniref:Anti-sigma factor n=1 Tax=Bacillus clarus TaxID=2338372 RepID=A0A090ZBY9_9BACI|nr:SH3 domain-containing protein [Bacillus clarus]KFN01821.1 bacterial SH3 domain protein [Bacillus clarus]RFT65128.1 anti-sigma factor [Bacillus clarus]